MTWLLVSQVISSHVIDHVGKPCSWIPWARISTACTNVEKWYTCHTYMLSPISEKFRISPVGLGIFGPQWISSCFCIICKPNISYHYYGGLNQLGYWWESGEIQSWYQEILMKILPLQVAWDFWRYSWSFWMIASGYWRKLEVMKAIEEKCLYIWW